MTRPMTVVAFTLFSIVGLGCDRGASARAAADEHPPAGPAQAAPPDHGDHDPGLPGYAAVEVTRDRQQLLGITTVPVRRERIENRIRTVGLVQADETRTSHVHVKFDGFIEKIYVDFTGRRVRRGQPLFEVYSRDLLAAQQEYLASRSAAGRTPSGADPGVRSAADQLAAAARDRLRLFDVPSEVLAQIDRSGEPRRAITITSPQAGTVIEKQALEGLAVGPMTPLYVIADLSRVWVVADVYERDMAEVQLGQVATLRLDALPGRTFRGIASFVSPVVDQTTRTAKVRFEFANLQGELRPGMYATVEISAVMGAGLTVPSDAVVDTGERKIVFVARGQGRFEPRAIATGLAFDGKYQVLDGLREGEAIAATGQFLLDSESRIRGARTHPPGHGGGH